MKNVFLIVALAMYLASPLWAQSENKKPTGKSSSSKSSASDKSAKRKEVAKLIPEREAMAMTFMRKNHPELEELLIYLKENDPNRYRLAVHGLYRTSHRLAQYHDRGDNDRYGLELKLWQAESRGWLLIARMKMENTKELEQQLRDAVGEQMDIRIELLKLDRARRAAQLKSLDEQIEQITKNRDAEIEKQIRLRTGGSRTKTKAPPKTSNPSKTDARKAKN